MYLKFDNRQEGDYKDFVKYEKEDVNDWLKEAEEFMNEIEGLISRIIEKHK